MFRGTTLQKKTQRYAARKRRNNAVAKHELHVPRLVVTRSLVHIGAQLIDMAGKVVVAATDTDMSWTKSEKAFQVGKKLGEFAPTRTYYGHGADKKAKRK